jgi:hypothetical protein
MLNTLFFRGRFQGRPLPNGRAPLLVSAIFARRSHLWSAVGDKSAALTSHRVPCDDVEVANDVK